jgi:LmbE family N-acetylglucosaminyl deacetylase
MMFSRICISPHYDDAALSLGGTIHRHCRAGHKVLVSTVFAAHPSSDQPLSPLARRFHQRMGEVNDLISIRRAEDRSAMAVLGAESHWLTLQDAIYRGSSTGEWYYTSLADLFGSIHAGDRDLLRVIAAALTRCCEYARDPVFYAPLAVGRHVDHQLTHEAAWLLHEQGHSVAFYEEFPYSDPECSPIAQAADSSSLQQAVAAIQARGASCEHGYLDEVDLQARIDSVCTYRSQLGSLLAPAELVSKQIRAFTRSYSPSRMVERLWWPGRDQVRD